MPWQFFDSNGNEQVVTAQYTVVDYGPPLDVNMGNLDTRGVADMMQSYWINDPMNNASATWSLGQSTSSIVPMQIPYPISYAFVRMPMTWAVFASTTGATSTSTRAWTASQLWTYNMQLFVQRPAGATNSTSLSMLQSSSWGLTNQISLGQSNVASSWSMTQKITYPVSNGTSASVYTTFSTSTNANSAAYLFSTNSLSAFSGNQVMDFPWSTSLAAGDYWFAFGVSSSFATETAALSVMPRLSNVVTFYGNSYHTVGAWHEMGGASASSIIMPALNGSFSIAGGATTASLDMTRVSSNASNMMPVVAFHRTA